MADVTHLLKAAAAGDRRAAADLLPLVYDELRKLAAVRMDTESPDHTLQPTALVHEAYLRLIGASPPAAFDHRGHFFAAAAEAMRRILVEAARRKKREKHGGERPRVELVDVASRDPDDRLLALDDARTRLAVEDPLAARVVELRHFTGAGHDAIAARPLPSAPAPSAGMRRTRSDCRPVDSRMWAMRSGGSRWYNPRRNGVGSAFRSTGASLRRGIR